MYKIAFILSFFGVMVSSLLIGQSDSILFEKRLDVIGDNYRNDLTYFKNEITVMLDYSKRLESNFFVAKCYHLLGKIYVQEAEYDSAQYYFLESLEMRKKGGYLVHAATTHESIAKVHFRLGEDSIALDHLLFSLKIKEEIGNQEYLMSLYNSLGSAYFNLDDLDSAEFYYLKGFNIGITLKDTQMIAASYTSLGDVLYMEDKEAEAIRMYKESVRMYLMQGRVKESAVPLYNLGGVFDWLGRSDSAVIYYQKALTQAKYGGNREYLDMISESLADVYLDLNKADSAIVMLQNTIAYRDSVFNEDKVNSINNAEKKYQTKEAQQQAAFEKSEKERIQAGDENKRLTIYALLIAIGLIGIAVLLWWRNARQKAKVSALEVNLKNQEIDKLLKEQEAKSYAALLEGQNAERERIAQDLHDQLGGTLSAVKVHFGVMDQKIDALKSENRDLFDKVNKMLTDAVQDVRRISHDLASGRIARLGLRGALNDLAKILNTTGKLEVDFFMDEALPELEKKKEQEIYAIVQELVSNTLKHARAKTLDLHLNRQDQFFNLMVEDDGVGFSMEKEREKGLGMAGITKRVNALGGTLAYDAVIGRGTIVIINIPI